MGADDEQEGEEEGEEESEGGGVGLPVPTTANGDAVSGQEDEDDDDDSDLEPVSPSRSPGAVAAGMDASAPTDAIAEASPAAAENANAVIEPPTPDGVAVSDAATGGSPTANGDAISVQEGGNGEPAAASLSTAAVQPVARSWAEFQAAFRGGSYFHLSSSSLPKAVAHKTLVSACKSMSVDETEILPSKADYRKGVEFKNGWSVLFLKNIAGQFAIDVMNFVDIMPTLLAADGKEGFHLVKAFPGSLGGKVAVLCSPAAKAKLLQLVDRVNARTHTIFAPHFCRSRSSCTQAS